MQRIAFVCSSREFGGAERSLFELISALMQQEEIEIVVVAMHGSVVARKFETLGVKVATAPFVRLKKDYNPIKLLYSLKSFWQVKNCLRKIFTENKITLVHANGLQSCVFAASVASNLKLPLIWHLREASGPRGLLTMLGKMSHKIIATSDYLKNWLEAQIGMNNKTTTIYNQIAPHQKPSVQKLCELKKELNINEGDFVVGSAGCFVPWKRHEDFIEAVKLARAKTKRPIKAILLGADIFNENRKYENALTQQAMDADVTLAGWRDDARDVMSCFDVFVSASNNEPFGRVLVEAMQAGAVVVSTDTGGKKEIIEDYKTGRLVKQNSAEKIADAIIELEADTKLRESLIGAAQKITTKELDVDRIFGI